MNGQQEMVIPKRSQDFLASLIAEHGTQIPEGATFKELAELLRQTNYHSPEREAVHQSMLNLFRRTQNSLSVDDLTIWIKGVDPCTQVKEEVIKRRTQLIWFEYIEEEGILRLAQYLDMVEGDNELLRAISKRLRGRLALEKDMFVLLQHFEDVRVSKSKPIIGERILELAREINDASKILEWKYWRGWAPASCGINFDDLFMKIVEEQRDVRSAIIMYRRITLRLTPLDAFLFCFTRDQIRVEEDAKELVDWFKVASGEPTIYIKERLKVILDALPADEIPPSWFFEILSSEETPKEIKTLFADNASKFIQ